MPAREPVGDMDLRGGNRILLPRASAEEVGVIREEPDAGHRLQDPLAIGAREADLWLERPAIGAEVDELRRIVLSERRRDGEADADDASLLIRGKLLWRHRRRPVEVHGHTESRIAQSEPADLRGFTEVQTFDMTADHGHDHAGVGRSSGQAERPRERKRRRVDPGAGFVDRRRRIEGHIAEVEAVDDGEDVQPSGERPVRAGLELLRRCGHRQQEERERGRGAAWNCQQKSNHCVWTGTC